MGPEKDSCDCGTELAIFARWWHSWVMTTTVDRIRDLISDSGLTQAAFAERVGMEQTKLSKSLTGTRRFSSLDLALISEQYRVSVDWLLTGSEPQIATAAQKSAGSSSAVALDLGRSYVSLRADLARLGYRQTWKLPKAVQLSGSWADQGKALADSAITAMESAGHSSIMDLFHAIPATFGIDIAVQPLGGGFDGLAVATEDARLILVNIMAVPARQRFTIAHELGHLLASDDQQIHSDEDIYAGQSKHGESEVRANAFAAAFLMPEHLLRTASSDGAMDHERFCQLASELHVSPSSLAYRLEGLRIIDKGAVAHWTKTSAAKAAKSSGSVAAYAKESVVALTPRPPSSLVADAFAAYQAGDITLRPYAQLVGASTMDLRKQFAANGQE